MSLRKPSGILGSWCHPYCLGIWTYRGWWPRLAPGNVDIKLHPGESSNSTNESADYSSKASESWSAYRWNKDWLLYHPPGYVEPCISKDPPWAIAGQSVLKQQLRGKAPYVKKTMNCFLNNYSAPDWLKLVNLWKRVLEFWLTFAWHCEEIPSGSLIFLNQKLKIWRMSKQNMLYRIMKRNPCSSPWSHYQAISRS